MFDRLVLVVLFMLYLCFIYALFIALFIALFAALFVALLVALHAALFIFDCCFSHSTAKTS